MEQIKHISLEDLHSPEFDARLHTDPERDEELKDSIRELGILEPLLVRKSNKGYEIIAGHRRFREAGRAGLAAVPCIIRKATGAECDKIKLHENIKRLPLSHVDQAYTFSHLIKEYNLTEQQVADLVGKSIAYVSQHLSLLQCDKILLASVNNGQINFSAARELLQCKDPDERHRLRTIVEENGATVPVIKQWVQESNRETATLTGNPPETRTTIQDTKPDIPMYPCVACATPVEVQKLKIVRLCEECHHLIFSSIEREKMKIRMEDHK